MLVVDVEGRISLANTAAAHITGYSVEQIRSMPVARLLQDDSSGLRTVVRRRIEDGDVLRREESWLVTHDGVRIPVSVTGSPVLTPEGELHGIVLVARDTRDIKQLLAEKEAEIRRRRQAEDELRALNATIESQLEQARASLLIAERRATLGTLAGGVGHELRNIAQIQVAAVDELSSALAAKEDVTELARTLLPDLERVAEHITTHGNRLMQLARPGPDRVEPLDLNAVLRDVIMMLRGAAKLGRLDVKLDFKTDPLMITANRVRIEQIIFNLVVNAVDAIGDSPGAITLRTFTENDRAICKIIDTGSGMPPETLARIFEPLFTTKGDKGTGFGLPVARDIVQGYGGKLTCESKLGAGTTFTFDLPQPA
ncbi:MAG: ATP-binding protein [Myxococcota bacterium]|nr:PAS domain S-box protein [Deltaproteobacteria bacterium]MDQ3338811.1 ATP-binding protein [Myxococcota bacterium]